MEEIVSYVQIFDLRDKWGRQKSDKRFQGHKFFGNLRCPCCNNRKVGIYASRAKDNYLVRCWRDNCTLSNAVTLSYAINNYGSSTIKGEWKKKTGWIDYKTATTSNQSRIESLEVNHQRPMKIPLEVKWNQGPSDKK